MTVCSQRQNSSDKRIETLQDQPAASHAHFKWPHSTNQRMQYRQGHTQRCLTNSTTTCGAWRTERRLQAIPFSSFPCHCHPIFSCSWSTVYAASVSKRAELGYVVFRFCRKPVNFSWVDLNITLAMVTILYATCIAMNLVWLFYVVVLFLSRYQHSGQDNISQNPRARKTTLVIWVKPEVDTGSAGLREVAVLDVMLKKSECFTKCVE